jgi:hypothetical protein
VTAVHSASTPHSLVLGAYIGRRSAAFAKVLHPTGSAAAWTSCDFAVEALRLSPAGLKFWICPSASPPKRPVQRAQFSGNAVIITPRPVSAMSAPSEMPKRVRTSSAPGPRVSGNSRNSAPPRQTIPNPTAISRQRSRLDADHPRGTPQWGVLFACRNSHLRRSSAALQAVHWFQMERLLRAALSLPRMRRGENVTEGGGVAREWRRQVADNRGADVLSRIAGHCQGKIVPNGTLTRA